MVTTSTSPLYRYTVVYTEASALSRIIDALSRFGLEPARLFSRIHGKNQFKVDVRVGGLCAVRANTLAARLSNIPAVVKVRYAPPPEDASISDNAMTRTLTQSALYPP
ncbi:MAG: hypothetical protein EPO08_14125 [Rhodospirillaceae bacterium]|nr:MAG: hypothetical protein EPO08_14125 [Rhodospirillaceae bacterium]